MTMGGSVMGSENTPVRNNCAFEKCLSLLIIDLDGDVDSGQPRRRRLTYPSRDRVPSQVTGSCIPEVGKQ